jgi:hypothetical protein
MSTVPCHLVPGTDRYNSGRRCGLAARSAEVLESILGLEVFMSFCIRRLAIFNYSCRFVHVFLESLT